MGIECLAHSPGIRHLFDTELVCVVHDIESPCNGVELKTMVAFPDLLLMALQTEHQLKQLLCVERLQVIMIK